MIHRYYIESGAPMESVEIALEQAKIEGKVRPAHLQRAARVLADTICEYPHEEQEQAYDDAMRWLEERRQMYRDQFKRL